MDYPFELKKESITPHPIIKQQLKRKRSPQLRLLVPSLLPPCVQPASKTPVAGWTDEVPHGATWCHLLKPVPFHILHANITCVFLKVLPNWCSLTSLTWHVGHSQVTAPLNLTKPCGPCVPLAALLQPFVLLPSAVPPLFVVPGMAPNLSSTSRGFTLGCRV